MWCIIIDYLRVMYGLCAAYVVVTYSHLPLKHHYCFVSDVVFIMVDSY